MIERIVAAWWLIVDFASTFRRRVEHECRPRPLAVPRGSARVCRVSWRSHSCDLPDGHKGTHICEPCPPDCEAPADDAWLQGWMADHCGSCSVHCGDRPADDELYLSH
ncbi:hypothetical protein [Mycolicibacterium sphagni]|uniref:hypothetical protein n=1 Tax=Mycolicibacterium sphagni TaxID=1786 RepID=UPI0021F3329B|nr:hypothetical protein [Mycolicibacterium sphagni]MCV7174763.1 hypothetical protein [Mycolicibacterium sphagni]